MFIANWYLLVLFLYLSLSFSFILLLVPYLVLLTTKKHNCNVLASHSETMENYVPASAARLKGAWRTHLPHQVRRSLLRYDMLWKRSYGEQ